MIPFLGEYRYAVDEKGRVNVPAKFRDILKKMDEEQQLVLTKGFDSCLYLFPIASWERFQEQLSNDEMQAEGVARYFERLFVRGGSVLSPDAQGRIPLTSEQRAWAQISKEVIVFGNNRKMELWSPAVFEKYMNEGEGSDQSVEQMAKQYFRKHF
ncbi:MAG: division/cell wall cluster transcriptional repressor MraZ [Candidatus Eisenbacteria bacterium]|nr:division/cell wall cluster transcriptional repressor MraZ [Candidatus Eisenbacteria bacterium]